MTTSLLNQIKADQVQARKDRNAPVAGILTLLFADASMVGKNAGRETTNDEVVAMVKKFCKSINECMAVEISDTKKVLAYQQELDTISKYLPQQITAEAMFSIIRTLRGDKGSTLNLGEIMKYFKEYLSGKYDGKLLASVSKEYIQAQV